MRVQCPDNCDYRQKDAPVCGFCLMKILESMKLEDEDGGEENGSKEQVQGTGETLGCRF